MRTITLVSLYTHIPVEEGDIIEMPGASPMVYDGLDEANQNYAYAVLEHTKGSARLSASLGALGLAFIDQDLVVKRPFSTNGVDHRAHRIIPHG